ncbi:RING finger protein [Trichophyton interdigitale]|uniref:RING finger protein n=1 Tax=Trichophyton interdigitale TaxID=101480 RepID=A0A9P4YHF3_9EURO|nr:RING finger protein [Trichophyton interdigitale]KAF3896166.1 RING finger protein [Trichophyton interdigitale]KAG8208262.1 RING finger protein [Trichophyton interdigitale]
MTTTAPPACPSTSTPSFGSRLRRLSQRRPQTHAPSTVPGPSASSNHRSYRKRLSWVVGRGSSHLPAAPEGEEDGAPHHHQHQHLNLTDHDHDHDHGNDHDHDNHHGNGQPQENSDLLHAELDRSASAELESSSQRYSVFSRSDAESSESSTSEDRPEQLVDAGLRSRRQQAAASQDTTGYTMAQALNMASVVVGAAASSPVSPTAPVAAAETGRAPGQPTSSTAHPTSQNGLSSPAAGESTEMSTSESNSPGQQHQEQQSIIRFFAYQDPHQNSRPSLPFAPMTRTITDESTIIKVGRYSEREGIPPEGAAGSSSAPVGFKSKVVSRKHCEFSFIGGQWHIKDVGSSSGTFLNHMRLSQPNVPSRQYAVRDGDIVQLGIDFRGGEELIFRCVRIRIECNRMWQQRANQFNKNTEALITNLGKGSMDATDYEGCRECSICLGSVLRPYQCLFMAACAHVWHYKCIRRLIHSPEYPMFQCPNCRAYTDLNAEVDDSNDPYEDEIHPSPNIQQQQQQQQPQQPQPQPQPQSQQQPQQPQHFPPQAPENNTSDTNTSRTHTANNSNSAPPIVYTHTETDGTLATATGNMTLESDPEPEPEHEPSDGPDGEVFHPAVEAPSVSHANDVHHSQNIDILSPNSTSRAGMGRRRVPDRANRDTIYVEDPLTPRNDTGLLALDGRAGRL